METLRERVDACSLPAALEAMGGRWSYLLLRAAFDGLHHSEAFRAALGSRATFSPIGWRG